MLEAIPTPLFHTSSWSGAKFIKHLCGLVVRVSGYRSRCPGFDSRLFQIFLEAAGLERGLLSLMITTEELLEERVAASV
jgi:hypothetical protein